MINIKLYTIGFFLFWSSITGQEVSSVDIHLRGGAIGGELEAGDVNLTEWSADAELDVSAKIYPDSANAGVLFAAELDGITAATSSNSPLRLRNNPTNIIMTTGLALDRAGHWKLKFHEHIIRGAEPIKFPISQKIDHWLNNDSRMVQRERFSTELNWDLNTDKVGLYTDILYSSLSYDLLKGDHVETSMLDNDIWGQGAMKIYLLKKKNALALALGGTLKEDLNVYSGYDFFEGFGGLNTDLKLRFGKKKLFAKFSLYGRYIVSEIMAEEEFADGIGIRPRARLIFVPKPRFYIKADMEYEFAPVTDGDWFIKQRYELSIRKVWKSLAAFEVGGWSSMGTLFPRICGYVNGAIPLGNSGKLEFVPGLKGYMRYEGKGAWVTVGTIDSSVYNLIFNKFDIAPYENADGVLEKVEQDGTVLQYNHRDSYKYGFYRGDIELLLRYKLDSEKSAFLKNFALYWEVNYRLYNEYSENSISLLSPNVTHLKMSIGISNYL